MNWPNPVVQSVQVGRLVLGAGVFEHTATIAAVDGKRSVIRMVAGADGIFLSGTYAPGDRMIEVRINRDPSKSDGAVEIEFEIITFKRPSIQPATPGRIESWPHAGVHDDVIRIQAKAWEFGAHGSIWFIPRCPICKKSGHPNVTRSHYRVVSRRHCNFCKVRWDTPGEPYCSSHGNPQDLADELIYFLMTGNKRRPF